MAEKWIQKALAKHGSLHKQLGISKDKKIPFALLDRILKAKVGGSISYSRRKIRVTALLKKRANFARNLKKIKRK